MSDFQRYTLDDLDLRQSVIPVDVSLLYVAVAMLKEARRHTGQPRTREERRRCVDTAHALRIDTLLRHQSRRQPVTSNPPYLAAKLGLTKSACSEAMTLLAQLERVDRVGRHRLPHPNMPERKEQVGLWGDRTEAPAFVPVKECALWLPGADFVLIAHLHLWAEIAWQTTRKDTLPLSGPLGDPDHEAKALGGFPRDRLRQALDRLVGWSFLRREGGRLVLTPLEAQRAFEATRPVRETPLRRLNREVDLTTAFVRHCRSSCGNGELRAGMANFATGG